MSTTLERQLLRRIDFLEEVIDRLQEALGLLVEIEVHHKGTPGTKVVFELELDPGVWEDAENYPVLSEAIYTTLKYKIYNLLKEGHNGWATGLVEKKTKTGG